MRKQTVLSVSLGVALLTTGCQTMGGDSDRPARIVNSDDASRAALQSTVNGILNTDVTLAENALTESSMLIIELSPPRKMENPNPQGRIMDEPIQFRLVINDSDCILIDQRNESRHLLENTDCVAE
jgi:hypothetical protein